MPAAAASQSSSGQSSQSQSPKVKPPPPSPELQAFKALSKGKHSLCTPTIDKQGSWTWRGKELERVWNAIVGDAAVVEKRSTAQGPVGGFVESYEATSGDIRVYGGTCRGGACRCGAGHRGWS